MPALIDRTCRVCGVTFPGYARASLCSDKCRRARRRGRDAGTDHLPPPVRTCAICGAEFAARNLLKTCSAACLKARRQARFRASYRQRAAHDPDLSRRNNQKRRERAARDPEYAARVAEWERKRQARHRARMAAEPEYAAEIRARARACYAVHGPAIQARRRVILETMADEALADLRARLRRYSREWRRAQRRDPAYASRELSVQREWRRRRAGGLFALGTAQLLAGAAARLESPTRIKACDQCGQPIVGRIAQARSCSDACAAAIARRRSTLWRAARRRLPTDRTCPICATPIDPTTARITCSRACATERKRRQKQHSRGKS